MQKLPKIIMGIDPGTVVMGYSIIEVSGHTILVKEIGVLKLPPKKDNYEKLQLIYQRVIELVHAFSPHELAIEAPFFGKNVQSMLKLGRAQGVAIAAAMSKSIPVTEYSPKRIKQSITGKGTADKEQVWKMLAQIVSLPDKPKYYDASDALAVAVCHSFSGNVPAKKTTSGRKPKLSSWEQFAAANPGRVEK